MIPAIYFNDYSTIQPINPVTRIEKPGKSLREKNKKQSVYKSKGKKSTNTTSGEEDYLPKEESLFDRSV